MKFSLGEISALIDGKIEGDPEIVISRLSSLKEADMESISFLANPRYESDLYTTKATAVIIADDLKLKKKINASLIRTQDPYLAFATLLEEYQRLESMTKTGIEGNSHIGESSTYEKDLYLGAFAYIGDRVSIGSSVKIYPQVYIGDDVKIGNNTIIYPGVKIYSKTKIGNYCTIHAGAVIGSHGFGFAPQPDGTYKNIPQIGSVILEDHVDIGANTTIDCGTLESTIIGKGVKIDNLVQVAHNVEIGENTVIAAQTGISGSTKIGKKVLIGGQVGVEGHITIADQTTVGAKSGVTKSVKKSGQTIGGKFAFNNPAYLKSYTIFKKLPEVMDRIEKLEMKKKK